MDMRRGSLRSFKSDAEEATVDEVATVKASICDNLEQIFAAGFLTSRVEMKLCELGSSTLECKSAMLEMLKKESKYGEALCGFGIKSSNNNFRSVDAATIEVDTSKWYPTYKIDKEKELSFVECYDLAKSKLSSQLEKKRQRQGLESSLAATPTNIGVNHDLDEISLHRGNLDASVESVSKSCERLTTHHKANSVGKHLLKRECESYYNLLQRCVELLRSQERESRADRDVVDQHREEICRLRSKGKINSRR